MLKAEISSLTLNFGFVARTSRETFTTKETFFLEVFDANNPRIRGVGEVPVFPSLMPSFKDRKTFLSQLDVFARNIDEYVHGRTLPENSAIRFGFESAMADFAYGGTGYLQPKEILENIKSGIRINGLVWMDSIENMSQQIGEKINSGFKCLKLKIGSHDFNRELYLLKAIRSEFPEERLEIRVDANGAFNEREVASRLDALASLGLHSIEQPLPRDSQEIANVCKNSPVPIALDEDMIERWWTRDHKIEWLAKIKPHYIVLKPSLIGGFDAADEWIEVARELDIRWWATSALESNVGLSAIAQWLASHPENLDMAHGLGTGQIYTNNPAGKVEIRGERLFML